MCEEVAAVERARTGLTPTCGWRGGPVCKGGAVEVMLPYGGVLQGQRRPDSSARDACPGPGSRAPQEPKACGPGCEVRKLRYLPKYCTAPLVAPHRSRYLPTYLHTVLPEVAGQPIEDRTRRGENRKNHRGGGLSRRGFTSKELSSISSCSLLTVQ